MFEIQNEINIFILLYLLKRIIQLMFFKYFFKPYELHLLIIEIFKMTLKIENLYSV